MSAPHLHARELCVSLGGARIVDQVTLDITPGEVVGLVGPNGAGKSTLLKALAGVLPITTGDVHVAGRSIRRFRPRELARHLAYVPQDTALPFEFPSLEVVVMGRYAHHRRLSPTTADDYALARAALDAVGASHLAQRSVTTLSGGERQLIHFARAIAQEPEAILLDEPTSALDLRHQLHVLSLLREHAQAGQAVVVVLHDLNHAARFCDRIILLEHGRIMAAGTPAHVLAPTRLAEAYGIAASVRDDEDTRTLRVTALHTLPAAVSPPETTTHNQKGTMNVQH